jgi:hypothetical protein
MSDAETSVPSMYYGLCPDSTNVCARSYLKGESIDDGFTHWFSVASLPGGGGVGSHRRDTHLSAACGTVFQMHPTANGFCDSCGLPLIFATNAPSLGTCGTCRREYNESDLLRSFCPKCGAPIEIKDDIRQQMQQHRKVTKILDTIPKLRKYGYLSTHYGKEK